ncbi:MAG: histidine kinase, partial [Marinomonas sp.]
MNNNDVLFCRKAVVNRDSETVAYYILHPAGVTNDNKASFLSSLFVDVNLIEVTQQKTIYIKSSLDELQALPLQKNIHLVTFLIASTLNESDYELLSELRLQGHQLGIIHPQNAPMSADFFNVFSHVFFSLDKISVEQVIETMANPALSSKCVWVNKVEQSEQYAQLV